MRFAVKGPMKGDLQNPVFDTAFRTIEERRFLIEIEESFLNDILGFAMIAHDASRHPEDQSAIALEEKLQSA
jgi:hypothetical protein